MMTKRLILAFALLVAMSAAASAQVFPGISPEIKKDLTAAKSRVPFALPTWIPDGFKLSRVHAVLGRKVKIYDRQLVIVYSKQLANGRLQRFAFEAGFDGIGDLMYDGGKALRTPIGTVHLYYQPKDEDGKKLTDFAMTEWFTIGKTAFHYIGTYGTEEEGGDKLDMISQAETEKILKSLKRY